MSIDLSQLYCFAAFAIATSRTMKTEMDNRTRNTLRRRSWCAAPMGIVVVGLMLGASACSSQDPSRQYFGGGAGIRRIRRGIAVVAGP